MALSTQTRITLPRMAKRDDPGVPRSQTERLWLISGGLIAFVLVLIGYFFFISPERSNTSEVKGEVAAAQQQNAVLQAKIDALREQNKNLPTYEAELARARLALPTTTGVPDFLRTLQALSSATQTDVTALSVGQPTAVTATAATTQPSAATSGGSTEPTATTSTAPAGTSAVAPAAAVYSLSINATVSGSTPALIKFLDQLQAVQPRAVLITQLTEAAAVGSAQPHQPGSQSSLQLAMSAFVAPAAAPAVASPSVSPTSH